MSTVSFSRLAGAQLTFPGGSPADLGDQLGRSRQRVGRTLIVNGHLYIARSQFRSALTVGTVLLSGDSDSAAVGGTLLATADLRVALRCT